MLTVAQQIGEHFKAIEKLLLHTTIDGLAYTSKECEDARRDIEDALQNVKETIGYYVDNDD